MTPAVFRYFVFVRESGREEVCLSETGGWFGNRHFHHGTAPFPGFDLQFPSAHHFQPLLNVFQSMMRPAVFGGGETGAVVLHDHLTAGIRFPCPDGDVQRFGIRIKAMFDGIFHDRLQCQLRYGKRSMRSVGFNKKQILKLGLFYSEVSPGMLQFFGERNGFLAGYGAEVFAQVGVEIQCDLLGLFRILAAEVIDAGHGVVNKVRPHLQHHDAGTLMGDLPMLTYILIDLI